MEHMDPTTEGFLVSLSHYTLVKQTRCFNMYTLVIILYKQYLFSSNVYKLHTWKWKERKFDCQISRTSLSNTTNFFSVALSYYKL